MARLGNVQAKAPDYASDGQWVVFVECLACEVDGDRTETECWHCGGEVVPRGKYDTGGEGYLTHYGMQYPLRRAWELNDAMASRIKPDGELVL